MHILLIDGSEMSEDLKKLLEAHSIPFKVLIDKDLIIDIIYSDEPFDRFLSRKTDYIHGVNNKRKLKTAKLSTVLQGCDFAVLHTGWATHWDEGRVRAACDRVLKPLTVKIRLAVSGGPEVDWISPCSCRTWGGSHDACFNKFYEVLSKCPKVSSGDQKVELLCRSFRELSSEERNDNGDTINESADPLRLIGTAFHKIRGALGGQIVNTQETIEKSCALLSHIQELASTISPMREKSVKVEELISSIKGSSFSDDEIDGFMIKLTAIEGEVFK